MARPIPEDRLRRLVEVATAVFIDQGFRQTRMEGVAAALGVAKGTVYLYVESKEALFDLVCRLADQPFEHPAGDGGAVILRSTYIRERRRLDAFLATDPVTAANERVTLSTLRVNATYEPSMRYGFTAGVFGTGGTSDTLLYAPGPVTGSETGSPSTRGYIAELAVNPWQNVRLAAQHVGYTRFNGGTTDYDGSGRSAGNNGTLYLYTWVAW